MNMDVCRHRMFSSCYGQAMSLNCFRKQWTNVSKRVCTTDQSWWMCLIVPEHLQGWNKGWSGSAGALQIRHVSETRKLSKLRFSIQYGIPCSSASCMEGSERRNTEKKWSPMKTASSGRESESASTWYPSSCAWFVITDKLPTCLVETMAGSLCK